MPSEPINEFLELDVFLGNEPAAQHRGLGNRYFITAFTGGLGLFLAFLTNMGRMRPPHAGIQKHIAFTLIGLAIGEGAYNIKEMNGARRDAQIKHYIELHPEHFVNEERPKYKDVFERWHPIR